VLEDLGPYVQQVTFQEFMDFLAPPQPVFDLEATMKTLKAGRGAALTASARWKAFKNEPKNQSGTEDEIFKPMLQIFNKIVDAIINNSKLSRDDSLVEFMQNPSSVPMSNNRHNATRPDGYLVLKSRSLGTTISWNDILLSCEYKRNDGHEDLDDVSVHLRGLKCYHIVTPHPRMCASTSGACIMSCGMTLVTEPRLA
jgi:hypothetical protein